MHNLTAVIVEPGVNAFFEVSVRNALFHLGNKWKLDVYHSNENEQLLKDALEGVQNVRFMPLQSSVFNVGGYNALMKDAAFWKPYANQKVLVFQSDTLMVKKSKGFITFTHLHTRGAHVCICKHADVDIDADTDICMHARKYF
jgi:hypothetical protein